MATSARTREIPVPRDPLVLVVEDEAINQLLMRAALIKAGCNARVVEDGAQAVELALAARFTTNPYALVMMDLSLPVMDGYEAARRIRAAGIGPDDLPIIAFTARWDDNCPERCRAAGMQDAIPTPLEILALHQLVERWCNPDPDDLPLLSSRRPAPANDGVCPWPVSSSSTTTRFLRPL